MTSRSAAVGRQRLPRSPLLRAGATLAALACALSAAPVCASSLAADTRLFLDRQALSLPEDVEITVGEPDSRLNLAQCARYEPFVPAGARLWGRTTLGVRCVEGATWTVFLPVQIKVYGLAPVVARSVARGAPLAADDVRMDRVDLTQWPPGTLAAADQTEGRLATRALVAGEPLRRDLLRTPPTVLQGDAVRIIYSGRTFVVSTEGRALTQAGEGQPVQAAIDGGKILSGIARAGKIVEMR